MSGDQTSTTSDHQTNAGRVDWHHMIANHAMNGPFVSHNLERRMKGISRSHRPK